MSGALFDPVMMLGLLKAIKVAFESLDQGFVQCVATLGMEAETITPIFAVFATIGFSSTDANVGMDRLFARTLPRSPHPGWTTPIEPRKKALYFLGMFLFLFLCCYCFYIRLYNCERLLLLRDVPPRWRRGGLELLGSSRTGSTSRHLHPSRSTHQRRNRLVHPRSFLPRRRVRRDELRADDNPRLAARLRPEGVWEIRAAPVLA